MTVNHHPPEEFLADFATGGLDEADHLALSVHVAECASCRRFIEVLAHLAGAALEDAAPIPMKAGAFDAIMAKIDAAPLEPPAAPARFEPRPHEALPDEDLPEILRRCRFGQQRRVAPGVKLQPIILAGAGKSRAFLLWSAPGTRMLQHSHTGTELTCVLKGSFSHEGGRYGPGDFDFGDDELDHQPIVGGEEPCLCLVAMSGELRLNGWLGRLISPFVRL